MNVFKYNYTFSGCKRTVIFLFKIDCLIDIKCSISNKIDFEFYKNALRNCSNYVKNDEKLLYNIYVYLYSFPF